ncbi:Vacuolar protein sorting-associated protein 36 [Tetrabaena socialis]|uniref:Vacuolar protein-sorting-associated protein 36 n=1 Tax=Tetrabaena socialis TaxID=47790 RepID=A0A2J8A1P6_9CHLO|nr:Vacuolar protein sorting-associated protein 36 [Tetrabaena socialis]|eukprot:PNH06425.1 Vacuolar protein sorting-associated protein 36 [Tetrabaena socialis]
MMETGGARYHIELCRQLADFLSAPLQRCGGLLSLPDVYCLFNRARGTELVSPDDLLQAAKLFGQAGVQGLRLRNLSSGVLVIQGPQHSEEQVAAERGR